MAAGLPVEGWMVKEFQGNPGTFFVINAKNDET